MGENQMLLGECKWRNDKADEKVLQTLVERGELLHCPEKFYYFFSKSGFAKNAEEAARQYAIRCISFREML